ncbi:hypothetical protein ERJ75_000368700 [Trypanosoma vivax]|nr:hypothetical protein ERJ75_000368700 [Trypanosoma vivax]
MLRAALGVNPRAHDAQRPVAETLSYRRAPDWPTRAAHIATSAIAADAGRAKRTRHHCPAHTQGSRDRTSMLRGLCSAAERRQGTATTKGTAPQGTVRQRCGSRSTSRRKTCCVGNGEFREGNAEDIV